MPTLDLDTEPAPRGIGFALLLGGTCGALFWAAVAAFIYWPI